MVGLGVGILCSVQTGSRGEFWVFWWAGGQMTVCFGSRFLKQGADDSLSDE